MPDQWVPYLLYVSLVNVGTEILADRVIKKLEELPLCNAVALNLFRHSVKEL